jgi:uncharacterized membrane protein YeaQ/YmgE (transglycosylase-associated protein family)
MTFGAVLIWLLVGLVAGAIARLLIPGRQPMNWVMTMVLGLVGSLVGGFLSWALFAPPDTEFQPAGLLMSILGAVLVLGIYVALARPGQVRP